MTLPHRITIIAPDGTLEPRDVDTLESVAPLLGAERIEAIPLMERGYLLVDASADTAGREVNETASGILRPFLFPGMAARNVRGPAAIVPHPPTGALVLRPGDEYPVIVAAHEHLAAAFPPPSADALKRNADAKASIRMDGIQIKNTSGKSP